MVKIFCGKTENNKSKNKNDQGRKGNFFIETKKVGVHWLFDFANGVIQCGKNGEYGKDYCENVVQRQPAIDFYSKKNAHSHDSQHFETKACEPYNIIQA